MAGHSDSSTVEVLKERLYSLQRRHEEDHQLKEDLQRHLCMVTAELDRVKGLNSTLKQVQSGLTSSISEQRSQIQELQGHVSELAAANARHARQQERAGSPGVGVDAGGGTHAQATESGAAPDQCELAHIVTCSVDLLSQCEQGQCCMASPGGPARVRSLLHAARPLHGGGSQPHCPSCVAGCAHAVPASAAVPSTSAAPPSAPASPAHGARHAVSPPEQGGLGSYAFQYVVLPLLQGLAWPLAGFFGSSAAHGSGHGWKSSEALPV